MSFSGYKFIEGSFHITWYLCKIFMKGWFSVLNWLGGSSIKVRL